MGPGLFVLVVVLAVLLLAPTRRLFLAGHRPGTLAAYLGGMLLLGILVAELRGPARYLVPVLLIGYLAPFMTLREGIARLLGRPAPPRVERTAPRPVDGTTRDPGDPPER
jgi:hypothetical protein